MAAHSGLKACSASAAEARSALAARLAASLDSAACFALAVHSPSRQQQRAWPRQRLAWHRRRDDGPRVGAQPQLVASRPAIGRLVGLPRAVTRNTFPATPVPHPRAHNATSKSGVAHPVEAALSAQRVYAHRPLPPPSVSHARVLALSLALSRALLLSFGSGTIWLFLARSPPPGQRV